jgi:hypothetical protein
MVNVITTGAPMRSRKISSLRREHVSIDDATVHGAHGPIDAQPVAREGRPGRDEYEV